MTIEELNLKRDALITAMATGVLRVRVGEIETVYQTTDEMRKALSVLNSEITSKSTASTGTRFSTTSFNRA
jgi:hypothetical protein